MGGGGALEKAFRQRWLRCKERMGTTKAAFIVGSCSCVSKLFLTRCCPGDRDGRRRGSHCDRSYGRGLNLLGALSTLSLSQTHTLVCVTAAKSLLILLCSRLTNHGNAQTQTCTRENMSGVGGGGTHETF